MTSAVHFDEWRIEGDTLTDRALAFLAIAPENQTPKKLSRSKIFKYKGAIIFSFVS